MSGAERASAPGAGRDAASAPTFSVVIPTHESRDYVVAAIRSVLGQTDPDFEIVVIDNGSSDGTEEAVGAIGDPRIAYRWQEDSGLPADSRNRGIELCRGEWIAFLDADDEWKPDKLAAVRAAIQADPGIDIVCHDVEIIDAGRMKTGKRAYRLDDRSSFEQLLYRGNFLSTSATTVRASAIRDAGGFDVRQEYFTVEDYDLWLRLARTGSRIAIVPRVLGSYLVHPGGASNRLVRHYDALMRVFDDRVTDAALAGDLDVDAAIARRRRSRLAEARDLGRRGALADAARIIAEIPREVAKARARYEAALGEAGSA